MKIETHQETASPIGSLPYRQRALEIEQRGNGTILLRTPHAEGDSPRSIAHLFEERALSRPDHPFLLKRGDDGSWHGLSYGEMRARARAIAAWLINRNLPGTGGVMILSGNSIEHAAMMLGCYLSGTASTALSQAFSTASNDFVKLRHCFATIKPRLVFVQSGKQFGPAIDQLRALDPALEVVAVESASASDITFDEISSEPEDGPVDAALAAIGPHTVAKYLFTSGSTGMPKAVPQTHGMMAATVAARHGLMQDPADRLPAIAVDWMPWSHLSAGNIGFNHNIWAGGTFYIDDGRPIREAFAETLRNLLELQPSSFSSAPIAFEMLAHALEADREAAATFFAGWPMAGRPCRRISQIGSMPSPWRRWGGASGW